MVEYAEEVVMKKKTNSSKYLEESVVGMLEELLGEGQLGKMMGRLEQDLSGRSKNVLINHFRNVFNM